jgi:type IV secretory pathway VirB4 component
MAQWKNEQIKMRLFKRKPKLKPEQNAPLVNVLDHDLVDAIAPAAMDFSITDCCAFSPTEWNRVWYVRDWPRSLGYEHWRSLLRFPGDVRVSLFLEPLAPAFVSKQLEQQATAIQTSRFMRVQQKRDPSPSENQDYQEIMEERQRVEIEGEPFYLLTATLGLAARSKEELDRWSEKLENQCRDAGLVIDRAIWEQDRGLLSLLPHNVNLLGNHQRNARLDTLMNLFPFVGYEIVMPEGVYYGYNAATGMSVVLDPFALENPNTVIIGIPGSGKSYFMKDLIEQYLLAGARVYVLDIEDEYRLLCEDLGGVYLDMGIKSEHKINVLDPDPEDDEGLAGAYQGFRGWLVAAVGRGLLPQEVEALDKAYYTCFARRGIDRADNRKLRRPPPILSDLHDALIDLGDEYALSLASALYPMARGMESEAFNCATNIDVRSNPLVVFGLKTVQETMKPRRIRQIQQFTWNQMLRQRAGQGLRRTIEIVDEAWYLLQNDDTAQDVAERARRFRKKNAALFLATQFADDFAANRYAGTILGLASTHLLFLQQATAVDRLAALFKLNETEKLQLTRLDPGQYFLKTNKLRMVMYKPVPASRHGLYTTRPAEVAALQRSRPVTK